MERLPVKVKITPREIEVGTNQVVVEIKNSGDRALENLEVGLSSLDQRQIEVEDPLRWVNRIEPDGTASILFNVSAYGSANIYVRIFGYRGTERLSWESPGLRMKVGEEAAEIAKLLILGLSKQARGEPITAETTLRVFTPDSEVNLDYWVKNPHEDFRHLQMSTIHLKEPEEKHSVTFKPEKEGLYKVYAYLYERARQIDRQQDKVYIKET